jgi:hypothetical protein
MDLKLLADALMITLAPALPYLVAGGTEAVKAAGKKVGEEGSELIGKLWDLLRGKVEESPRAQNAAEEVAESPEDADARGGLRRQLLKILEADPELAAEVAKLLDSARGPVSNATVSGSGAIAQGLGAVAAGAGGVAVGGSVTGDISVGRPKRRTGG